jgi:hypothetical protein
MNRWSDIELELQLDNDSSRDGCTRLNMVGYLCPRLIRGVTQDEKMFLRRVRDRVRVRVWRSKPGEPHSSHLPRGELRLEERIRRGRCRFPKGNELRII